MNTFIVDSNDPIYWIRWRHGDPNYRNVQNTPAFNTQLGDMLTLLRRAVNINDWRREIRLPVPADRQAIFIIQSIDNPNISWAYNNGESVRITEITPAIVEAGVETMIQSGRPDEAFYQAPRFRFGFAFPPTPRLARLRGRGKTKIPSWCTKRYQATWMEQVLFY